MINGISAIKAPTYYSPVNNTLRLKPSLQQDTVSFSAQKTEFAISPAGHFALIITNKAQHHYNNFIAMTKRILGESFDHTRAKDNNSVKKKLEREFNKEIKNNPNYRITTIKALDKVKDLLGARGVTDGSEKSITDIIDRLAEETRKGNCEIKEIRNYRGELGATGQSIITPYLTGDHVATIVKAQSAAGNRCFSINTKEGAGKTSKGYTAGHILGIFKGIPFEIQIKGRHVKEIDDGTHLLHDLGTGKGLKTNDNEELTDIQKAYNNLPVEVADIYKNYIAKAYQAARVAELKGTTFIFPSKPRKIPNELKLENLINLAREQGLT